MCRKEGELSTHPACVVMHRPGVPADMRKKVDLPYRVGKVVGDLDGSGGRDFWAWKTDSTSSLCAVRYENRGKGYGRFAFVNYVA